MKPYISLDIETTGTHKDAQIIEIAAVYDDLVSDIKDLPTFHCLIKQSTYSINEWVLKNNYKKIIESLDKGISEQEAQMRFKSFCLGFTGRQTAAGKNVAWFDMKLLDKNGYDLSMFSHRMLDVGNLYISDFGYIPTLSEINKKLNREEVSHNALNDCYDVIHAVRNKLC